MHILLILSSPDPEIKWNAVVRQFFVECGRGRDPFSQRTRRGDLYSGDGERFPIAEQAKLFALSDGTLAA